MKIIKSNNFIDAEIGAIKQIVPNSFSDKYIVITPDRYSLSLEKNIFQILNVESLFNVKVMGIAKFAKSILSQKGIEKESVSDLGTLILIRLAIIRKQSELKCFKEVNFGVCEQIKNTISQFKSACISPFEKFQVNEENLKIKLDDIFLIYNEYEKLLNGRLDSAGVLNELDNALGDIKLKDTTVLFVGFDSLTNQGMTILTRLNEVAKGVVVALTQPFLQANAYVYENDLWNKIKALNTELNVIEIPCSLQTESRQILENLFAYKVDKYSTNNIALWQASDMEEEVKMVARKIKELLTCGYRYKDIQIAVAGLDKYSAYIEKIFSRLNFSYYLDNNIVLKELFPIKFIFIILNLFLYNFKKEDLISYILSPFCECENKSDLINQIYKYDINANIKFIKDNFEKLSKLLNIYKNCKNYIDFLENIINIYEFKEKIINFSNAYAKNNEIKQEKIYIQLYDKIISIIDNLKTMGVNETLSDFIKILDIAFSSQKISTVPASVDNIVVIDATSGFIPKNKILFVIGATESDLPNYLSDCGVLTDKDIERIEIGKSIEPTIKMINRRNKFKLLSVMSAFDEKLFVSYPLFDNGEKQNLPSSVIKSLQKIFENNGQGLHLLSDKYIQTGEELSKQALQLAYLSIDGQDVEFDGFNDIVNKSLIDLMEYGKKEDVYTKKLIDKKLKVTQIETYLSCPFKHFCSYKLNLKEKVLSDITPADIGNFIHKFLENVIFDVKNVNFDEVISKIFKEDKFYKFNLKKNLPNKENIIKEMKSLLEFLSETYLNSSFVPYLCEKKIKYQIDTKNNQYNLVGVVDRIDKYKDYFRIVDYKTGGKDLGNFEELYYGEKLQLFLYLKFVEKETNLIPVGVFYLKIKNNEKDKKLNGFYVDNQEILKAFDNTLTFENPTSRIIKGLKIKTNKENIKDGIIEYSSSALSWQTFNNMKKYAESITVKAIEEMEQGNIKPSPLGEEACKFCKFGAICKITQEDEMRKKQYKIKKDFFESEDKDD